MDFPGPLRQSPVVRLLEEAFDPLNDAFGHSADGDD